MQHKAALTQQVRCVQGYTRSVFLKDSEINSPASESTGYRNEFDQVAHPKEFEQMDKDAKPHPSVHDTKDMIATSGDPHVLTGFGEWKRVHYDWIREPTFPRTPAEGELATGANLTRTDVWKNPDEPAILSIAKFAPYNFRPVGYAENAANPDSMNPDGHYDFRHNRLPPGHADRRPALYFTTAVAGFIGFSLIRGCVLKAVHCLWPARDVFAAGVVEVDLRPIRVGQNFTAKWRGKPVFLRRRTPDQIAAARKDDAIVASLRDPATDAQRAQRPEWLIMIGVCTHLGCIPFPDQGDWNAYFCPCHGSHYDHAGRIRKGPAPFNLELPTYTFLDDNTVKVG